MDSSRTNRHISYELQFGVINAIMKTQSILIIHRFYICGSSYSLKCIYNPKINTWSVFVLGVILGHAQSSETFELPGVHVPSWSWTSQYSVLSQRSYLSEGPFRGLFSAVFFAFLCFCWWFHCVKWSQSTVLKYWSLLSLSKEPAMCLTGKMHVI